ncbi:MAG: RadC family protein [Thermodesulfobacteriota bacterium]
MDTNHRDNRGKGLRRPKGTAGAEGAGRQAVIPNRELLERLLSYPLKERGVRETVEALIERFGGIRGVLDATGEELGSVSGVGENTSVFLKLIKEVAVSYRRERLRGKDAIRHSRELLEYLCLATSGEKVEKFLAVYLNERNEVISIEVLYEGALNGTTIYPRKAIEKAFDLDARAVIFAHNHTSGEACPSGSDVRTMMALDQAALSVKLIIHDHLIICKDTYFSARENGWIIGLTASFKRARRGRGIPESSMRR